MHRGGSFALSSVLAILAAVLVWKVALSAVYEYRNYLPPDFESDFLRGREAYFWGPYRWAFYAHLMSGPPSLLLGTVLVSSRLRSKAPAWHRRLGRLQAVLVLLLVAPSGLWMAFYAESGAVATGGLGSLAVATAACVAVGWRSAVMRRLADHRRWMWRTFMLLCSAVVIRMIGGMATVAQFEAAWLYPFSTWASWLAPLLAFELTRFLDQPSQQASRSGAL